MKIRARRLPLFSAMFAVILAGCASGRAPLVLDEALEPAAVDEVLVMPAIDARPAPQEFEQVQVARNVGDAMVRYLRERGYFTIAADRFEQRPSDGLDLRTATAAQLVPMAPEDAKYFVMVRVERLEHGADPNVPTVEARLSAVMVDRPRARVVWRDVATGRSSLSGALTVFSRGSRQYEAAVNASRELVDTLPDRRAKSAAR
jgi:hypothetical protein